MTNLDTKFIVYSYSINNLFSFKKLKQKKTLKKILHTINNSMQDLNWQILKMKDFFVNKKEN